MCPEFNSRILPTNNFLAKHSLIIYVSKHISVIQKFAKYDSLCFIYFVKWMNFDKWYKLHRFMQYFCLYYSLSWWIMDRHFKWSITVIFLFIPPANEVVLDICLIDSSKSFIFLLYILHVTIISQRRQQHWIQQQGTCKGFLLA